MQGKRRPMLTYFSYPFVIIKRRQKSSYRLSLWPYKSEYLFNVTKDKIRFFAFQILL